MPEPHAPDPPPAAGAPPPPDPRSEYAARREARRLRADAARRQAERLSNTRLLVFFAGGAGVWLAWGLLPEALLIGIPALAFAGLVVLHARARRVQGRAERAVAYYDRCLARLDHRFAGRGDAGLRFFDDTHPYAGHLDLFGEGSLYELLCTARTAAGKETLAAWLLAPAPPNEIGARQAAAAELRANVDLREDLAVIDAETVAALDSDRLAAWGERSDLRPGPGGVRVAALVLAGLAVATAVAIPWVGTQLFVGVLLVELLVWLPVRRRVSRTVAAIDEPVRDLRLVCAVLERVERERFASPRLASLQARLAGAGGSASRKLAGLVARADALELRRNQFFAPIALVLMWATNWAFEIERWRVRWGSSIRDWLTCLGELEALLDLAGYAFEHPADPWPVVKGGSPRIEGEAIGHPLLAPDACVVNDVALDESLRLIVVTGSNMSGKTTLLRALGVNVVLAGAGAPARARSLRMSPLSVGASIQNPDSLREGASRFYAEVRAIKRAMVVAETAPPGLFLLDELLDGTNSHDRRTGAEAIVRGFLSRGAIGLVTTHDLALAEIAEDLSPLAANAHFEFALEDGELSFDYRLRPGIVRTGNALEIMRAVGIEV